jgi:hypothetical protein
MSTGSSQYQQQQTQSVLEDATAQNGGSFDRIVDRFRNRMQNRCDGPSNVGLLGDDTGSGPNSTSQTPLKLSQAVLRDGFHDNVIRLGGPGAIAVASTRGQILGNGTKGAVAFLITRFTCRR